MQPFGFNNNISQMFPYVLAGMSAQGTPYQGMMNTTLPLMYLNQATQGGNLGGLLGLSPQPNPTFPQPMMGGFYSNG